MKQKVFAVYDDKVGCYMHPFHSLTQGSAIRQFVDTVQDPKSILNRHPEDFTLFELGAYDEEKGAYENLATPKSLGKALEYKAQQTEA